jgi:hypothetical protein
MTFAKYSIVLFCSFGIATIGLVAAQESPAELASNVVPGTREIHVSPQGNDENDGSAANPLASLEAAQPHARTARGTTVVIHGGTYCLNRKLEFTHAYEGVEFLAAPSEKVSITSDRKLFTPLIEVDSTAFPAEPFLATSIRSSANQPLGPYRWLVWQVHSITPLGENTSFQEVQVTAP